MKKVHGDVCQFLQEVESDFHEIPAKTLVTRIDLIIIKPIDIALLILDLIKDIEVENIPGDILVRWNQRITQALLFGGEHIEY